MGFWDTGGRWGFGDGAPDAEEIYTVFFPNICIFKIFWLKFLLEIPWLKILLK